MGEGRGDGIDGGGAADKSMLLANVSQRCYFRAEMSHRRGARGAGHHHRRGSRHERPAVRWGVGGGTGLRSPVPDARESGGFFFCGHGAPRWPRGQREAKRPANEEERAARMWRRWLPERRGGMWGSTAPPSGEDVKGAKVEGLISVKAFDNFIRIQFSHLSKTFKIRMGLSK